VLAFFRAGLKTKLPRFLSEPATIEKCKVLKITDLDNGDVEFIALVHVNPEKAALKAIAKLNRTLLRGRLVEVRQYRYRSRKNDRRTRRYPVSAQHERRSLDRRRPNLEVEEAAGPAKIQAMDNFRRTYGG
jgi:hypothetical protein